MITEGIGCSSLVWGLISTTTNTTSMTVCSVGLLFFPGLLSQLMIRQVVGGEDIRWDYTFILVLSSGLFRIEDNKNIQCSMVYINRGIKRTSCHFLSTFGDYFTLNGTFCSLTFIALF